MQQSTITKFRDLTVFTHLDNLHYCLPVLHKFFLYSFINNLCLSLTFHQVTKKKVTKIPCGYSHIKTYGDVQPNGSLFHKKSLNMGSIFYKDIPKHGSVFSPPHLKKFGGLCLPCKQPKNFEKWIENENVNR